MGVPVSGVVSGYAMGFLANSRTHRLQSVFVRRRFYILLGLVLAVPRVDAMNDHVFQVPPSTKGKDAAELSLDQPWRDGRDPGFRPATVRVTWSAQSLDVIAELQDDNVFSRSTDHDQRMWELGDVFEVFLQVLGESRYVELHVTPNNTRLHLAMPGVGGRSGPGVKPLTLEQMMVSPPAFESEVTRSRRGWIVRASIPADVLGLEKFAAGMRLRASFCRYDAAPDGGEILSTTASHPVISFHRPDEWVTLELVGGSGR